MLSSPLYAILKLSNTTSPQKLFAYDCMTLYLKIIAYLLETSPNSPRSFWILA